MSNYVINFWVWWYQVKVFEFAFSTYKWVFFWLQYTNTLPMAQHLTVPMFQDQSSTGKYLSIFLRSIWIWWGGMVVVALSLPALLVLVVMAALPVLALGGVGISLMRLFS